MGRMSEPISTLALEPHDDAVSVRDRLSFVTGRRVLLVWPAQGRILTRKLDLLLVQRQAARLGLRIALVTSDPDVIEHAAELAISVFPAEQLARRAVWQQPRTKVFIPPRNPDEQAAIAARVAELRGRPLSASERRIRQAGRWLLFVLLLLALAAGFIVGAPRARVSLTPASRQVFESVTIVADPALSDVDVEAARVPATVVQLEATARVTVSASGVETAGASLAQGLVRLRNTSDVPVLIPLGAVVTTSGTYPVRFETLLEALLPAGADAVLDVPVRALSQYAGAQGNVGPGAINRVEADFADVVTVTNPNATYGGAFQEVKIVTAADHERLLALGRQQVLQNARDLLLHQLSGDQFLVPGSERIIRERPEWTLFSAIVGDLADSVSLDLRAEVQAVIVDERQARQVAYAGLAPYVQPGLEIAPGALRFGRGDVLAVDDLGRVTFLMTVRGSVGVAIDPEAVSERIAGRSVADARRLLEAELLLDPAHPPRIEVWPAWFGRLPVLPMRIDVQVHTP